jgi:hypothetical protein
MSPSAEASHLDPSLDFKKDPPFEAGFAAERIHQTAYECAAA